MITWTLPLKTVSEANSSEHWTSKSKRHRKQQSFVRKAYEKYVHDCPLPCNVHLVRLSPRTLDDDNLRTCLKYIRDEISECIIQPEKKEYTLRNGKKVPLKGRYDSDPRITWTYDQETYPIQCVKVTITPL